MNVAQQIALQNSYAYRAFNSMSEKLGSELNSVRELRRVPNAQKMSALGVFQHAFRTNTGAAVCVELDIFKREVRVTTHTAAGHSVTVLPKGLTLGEISKRVMEVAQKV